MNPPLEVTLFWNYEQNTGIHIHKYIYIDTEELTIFRDRKIGKKGRETEPENETTRARERERERERGG